MRGGEGRCLPERCHAPQGGSAPLHHAAFRGRAAVVEQLLAAGAALDLENEVRAGGGAVRRGLGVRTQLCVPFWIAYFVLL